MNVATRTTIDLNQIDSHGLTDPNRIGRCLACGTPLLGRTRRARYCNATCRSRAARRLASRSVALASHLVAGGVTRTPRNAEPRPDVQASLTLAGRCHGCGTRLGSVRAGTRCCSGRCRTRVHRWRKSGRWPRAELLAAAWGISPRDLWRTPPDLFRQYDEVFGFGLDCASAGDDALASTFITPEDNALEVSWNDRLPEGFRSAFCNPPYSRKGGGLLAWVEKALEERDAGLPSVLLVPPDPSTRYHQLLHQECAELGLTRKRVPFLHPDTGVPTPGNRGASMFAVLLPGHTGPAVHRFLDEPWSPAVSSFFGQVAPT